MGNVSYLSPTKNKENFKIEFIYGFLFAKFTDLDYVIYNEFEQLQVMYHGRIVTDLYFNQDCYLLKSCDEDDIKNLENINENKLINELLEFKKNNSNTKFVEMTHSMGIQGDKRKEIEKYLHDYFGLYIFDEGIHPEYIPPDYVWHESMSISDHIKALYKKL